MFRWNSASRSILTQHLDIRYVEVVLIILVYEIWDAFMNQNDFAVFRWEYG